MSVARLNGWSVGDGCATAFNKNHRIGEEVEGFGRGKVNRARSVNCWAKGDGCLGNPKDYNASEKG